MSGPWGIDKLNQGDRLPPPENPPPRKPPTPGTAWAVALAGLDDARCSFKDEHVFSVMHALGINPAMKWPPSPELEFALRETPPAPKAHRLSPEAKK